MRRLEWGRIGAWGRASQARTRETLGIRPARNWVCHRSWLDGDRRRREIAVRPSPRKNGPGFLRRRDGASKGVAVAAISRRSGKQAAAVTQGAPFGAPSPLIFEGRELKAQLARRREDESAWLFEILN